MNKTPRPSGPRTRRAAIEPTIPQEQPGEHELLRRLAAEHRDRSFSAGLRELAEDVGYGTLGLLFPHFAPGASCGSEELASQLSTLRTRLERVVTVLTPTNGAERTDPVDRLFSRLSWIRDALALDARAIFDGDPAAESIDEVILAYPGFLAIAIYRIAHELYGRLGVFPRLLAEVAHRATGIDIHPGARIGESFAIDHGTGIVIGESAVLGARVRLYQGVTLGAARVNKRMAHAKRHPTVGDDVVIYANATILGGETVIGRGSRIGGNVWLTRSVPPYSVVTPTARVERRSGERTPSDDLIEFNI